MAKRIKLAIATVLVSMFLASPAMSQPAAIHLPADTDLAAHLKELEGNPAQTEAMHKIGRKVAAVCAYCHGDGGNSLKPDIPNLAGQNPAYLLKQMHQFTTGERRNEFMQGLIKALKPEEKIGMVIFYSGQEVTHKPATHAALVSKGQEYYSKTCFRCHGEQGRGNEGFARIAGQQADYLTLTLKRYRDGSSVRKNSLMAANTRLMSDEDIAAVVAYVSSMK
ncbi:MAG: c-type cytochrome [Pseudomonadota bacterium]|nr:c-type cytochrome [Pseudomonadota bacterium]